MKIYPKLYLDSVTQITIEMLNKNNIRGLILDIDNTLIDYEKILKPEVKVWCENLKKQNIKMCILSNTNKGKKAKKVAEDLKLDYFYFAKKPLKTGFLKAQKLLEIKAENIAVVGDQIFTDILGAHRCNMFGILVKPIDEKDIWVTKIKRRFEQIIINKYLEIQKNKGGQ